MLQDPVNGMVVTSMSNMVFSIATYTCDSGFSGDLTTRVCTASGQWSGSDPTCDPDGESVGGVGEDGVVPDGESVGGGGWRCP